MIVAMLHAWSVFVCKSVCVWVCERVNQHVPYRCSLLVEPKKTTVLIPKTLFFFLCSAHRNSTTLM